MSVNLKVSVFTPTHDSRYLSEIYECLCAQTVKNWEWVIVYNGKAQIVDFGQDERVRPIVLGDNYPPLVGLLKAIACDACTGDILLELDHDDLLVDQALEEVILAFEQDPEVGFVYSNAVHINMGPEMIPIERFSPVWGWTYQQVVSHKGKLLDECISPEPRPEVICQTWCCPNHLRAFRSSVYRASGGFDRTMKVYDDIDLMCRLYSSGIKFHHINKGLYLYRYHGQNTFNVEQEEVFRLKETMYNRYLDSLINVWCDQQGLRKIEIGGRMAAYPGFETLDLLDADIIHDLNKPWPFADSSVGCVRAMDVLEHLEDKIFSMKELYRVLAPGGFALLQVPSTDGPGAFQDPTHIAYWNQNSFWYYTQASHAHYIGTPVRFQGLKIITTEPNDNRVCWVIAHLISLKDDFTPIGQVLI